MKPRDRRPDLTYSGAEAGFAQWQQQLEAHRRDLRENLGVPVGAKVRVRLRDFEAPFEGVLELVTDIGERNPKFTLRGLKFHFSPDEIVSLEMI